jgi:hypothetical protein
VKSAATGYKSAVFTVTANEPDFLPFRIRVMALVDGNLLAASRRQNLGLDSSSLSAPFSLTQVKPLAASLAPVASISPASVSSSWLVISPDGLFHHFFRSPRAIALAPEFLAPEFFVSAEGLSWEKSQILALRKISQSAFWDEFEAIVTPPVRHGPLILISQTATHVKNP